MLYDIVAYIIPLRGAALPMRPLGSPEGIYIYIYTHVLHIGTKLATSVNVKLPCLQRTCVKARFRETLRISPPSSEGAEVAGSTEKSHVWCRLGPGITREIRAD